MWPAPCRSSKPTTHGNLPHDSTYLLDGMLINSTIADGRAQNYIDNAIVQETTYQTSSVTAEVSGGGVFTNMGPTDSGNQFHGDFFLCRGRSPYLKGHTTAKRSS